QTYRYSEERGRSQLFLDGLINPGDRTGKELSDYLKANQDQMILSEGNNFPMVGGPTPSYNGFPFAYGPYALPYGGIFIPGVRVGKDGSGNEVYIENLGENIGQPNGTLTLPLAAATRWSFTRAALFDASYVKLREIVLSYDLPKALLSKIGI